VCFLVRFVGGLDYTSRHQAFLVIKGKSLSYQQPTCYTERTLWCPCVVDGHSFFAFIKRGRGTIIGKRTAADHPSAAKTFRGTKVVCKGATTDAYATIAAIAVITLNVIIVCLFMCYPFRLSVIN
jgi:hypothetical protein